MTAANERDDPRRQARVVGLISLAHLLSHFYMLALPPLFPVLHDELSLGYTQLGLALTAYAAMTGLLQTPMGFLCQRIGARPVLIGGLFLNAAAIALIGFVDELWQLVALMAVGGVGSSVFHPADYSILSGTVSESRLGRAFSVHTFCGSIGFLLAPVLMVAIASIADWRTALVAVGVAGIAVAGLILALSGLIGDSGRPRRGEPGVGWRELVTSRPILLFLLFYVGLAASNAGITQFGVAALTEVYGFDLALANAALTVYLVATLVGVLPGGWLADRTTRHDTVLYVSVGAAGVLVALLALGGLPFWLVALLLAGTGFMRGLLNASRDVMVRHTADGVSVGTVFAFVTTGYFIGQAVSPAFYGLLLDFGSPEVVFWASAGFSLLCVIGTLIQRPGRRAVHESGAA